MLLPVLYVKEIELQNQIVYVQMDSMKLIKNIVLNVCTDVLLVNLKKTVVLYVLKTESLLQLVNVLSELMIPKKLYVQIVTLNYVLPVLHIQIIVSLVLKV